MNRTSALTFCFISLILAFFSPPSIAESDTSHALGLEALSLFAQCDASFFNALKKQPDMLGSEVKIQNRGSSATITVNDPLSEKGSEQHFKSPVVINGLRLIAWHNNIEYNVTMGGFLFWGFKVNGDPDAVAKTINAMLPDSRKVTKSGPGWARGEIHNIGDPFDVWHPGGAGGTVAAKGTVERVLLIEQESPLETNVYCSLQGSITAPLLQQSRPDILTSEYPK
jgi:hypothetical protein